MTAAPPLPAENIEVAGDGVVLKGWLFRATGERRGTIACEASQLCWLRSSAGGFGNPLRVPNLIVYLHGSADNRASVVGVAQRYVPRGYDVLAYDSRAHGDSTGEACTYGFHEKRDLAKVIDSLDVPAVAVIGVSLGGAVALQAAAEDARVARVVAISSFSDLRTVASERAPFIASAANIREALAIAEKRASFVVDEVSPVRAAARLTIPVLLIHGALDKETPPAHSERIYQALKEPKRLLLLPKSGHGVYLDEATWKVIDAWLTPGK